MPSTTSGCSDDEARAFAASLGLELSEYALRVNKIALREAVESRERCANCPGLRRCKNQPAGYEVDAIYYAGGVQLMHKLCAKSRAFVRMRHNERILSSSRMPARLRRKTFDNYKVLPYTRQAYEAAKAAAAGTDGLFLIGSPGTGKTHLAVAIANERIEQGREAIFVTVPELMADMRQAMRTNEDTELMRLVKTCELLVLDDLGAERTTDWVLEQLFVIINARYLDELQTVVTSNYSQSELIRQMGNLPGHRIVSRLSEMCEAVRIDGKDWRLGGMRNA